MHELRTAKGSLCWDLKDACKDACKEGIIPSIIPCVATVKSTQQREMDRICRSAGPGGK
jgi:hypothetical protein